MLRLERWLNLFLIQPKHTEREGTEPSLSPRGRDTFGSGEQQDKVWEAALPHTLPSAGPPRLEKLQEQF